MFYTDWYDYPDEYSMEKLPNRIKEDAQQAKTETQTRPSSSDIGLMLRHLVDVYVQGFNGIRIQDDNNGVVLTSFIMRTLVELGEAAKHNQVYKEALLSGENFVIYCALFLLLANMSSLELVILDNLCKELAPTVKFSDVISAQRLILDKPKANMKHAAKVFRQLKDSYYRH